jgi:hypothetical protein
MSRIITKELAQKIAEKLGAVCHSKKNRPHDLYVVYHAGRRVAQFGIRRSSEKDKGHDHVPNSIFLSPHRALLLAQCPMSRDDWLTVLRGRGMI